jgi:hypothetical protein
VYNLDSDYPEASLTDASLRKILEGMKQLAILKLRTIHSLTTGHNALTDLSVCYITDSVPQLQ